VKGHTEEVTKLHRKHGQCIYNQPAPAKLIDSTGNFVRIAANEVSIAHPDAVRLLLYVNIVKV
jgi:hypothetical protein